jgi:2-phosphosulfolactate phosphatase
MQVGVADGRGKVSEIEEDDTAIVVDALRASATVAALLNEGARGVTPVTEVPPEGIDEAVLVGEEQGKTLEEASLGNSPTEVQNNSSEVTGKNVVLRTTNGTKCVERVDKAEHVYMGSLVNVTALADAVDTSGQGGNVWVVAAGRRGDIAPEDMYTAKRIASELIERGHTPVDTDRMSTGGRDAAEVFQKSDTGQFLRSIGQEKDIRLCSQTDVFDVAPVARRGVFVDDSA